MPKDTIRVLVDWKCNLRCAYCCNEQERFRKEIRAARLDDIDFSKYKTVCITGGEPLLFPDRIYAICQRVPREALIVLYTNGIMLDRKMALRLHGFRVGAINVGLHIESTFGTLIDRVTDAVVQMADVRFHAQDCYGWLSAMYPSAKFRFWKMDDCERENEDRVILEAPLTCRAIAP
jgi:molybdenum cofactor biosynthesis enzyme MoaA